MVAAPKEAGLLPHRGLQPYVCGLQPCACGLQPCACGLQPHVLPQASIGPPVTLLDAMRCALMPVAVPPPSGAVAWGQAACGEVHSAHPTCNPVYPACNPTSTYPACNPTYPARYLVCAHAAAA